MMEEPQMTFEPGQVVTLKSSSQPMTVVAVAAEEIECVWIGDEGEFFRESIPAIALMAVESDDEEDGEAEEDEDGDEESDASEPSGKRKVA
jgi:uncharacterized protein YodC (DUF2158 family)